MRRTLALAALGEKVLGGAVAVAVDHRPGGIQHELGGAIILLEPNRLCIRKIFGEAMNITNLGAAPTVNRLIIITDHHDTGIF